ncbi:MULTISPECIES: cell division protein ZipA [unclassified Endozoicomonas]|uniref:cell division protein ZipA n=3 Tax=Endozoicomonas TaxID=305899 RepID=UPI0021483C70|nr:MULTISPECIES: cell division protein ZipA [unclassified Endozoicomonas]
MSLRDWLVVIGIVVIIGVLADGYRRMRLARKRASELSFGLEDVKGNEDEFGSELPNGGARRSEAPPQKLETVKNWVRSEESTHVSVRERIEPEISSLGSEIMAPARPVQETPAEKPSVEAPEVQEKSEPLPVLTQVDEVPEVPSVEPGSRVKEPVSGVEEPAPVQESFTFKSEFVEEPQAAVPPTFAKTKPARTEKSHRSVNQEKLADRPAASEILVINLLAKGGENFDGARLLQSLMASGMRYGDMSIFHRYANKDGTGQILFSMANGVEPGTFDIGKLESTDTPAVSVFMGLPGPREPLKAFMLMEETVRQLALDLGGELKDEHFSVLTQQTLEHYRQRIRDFERKQLTQKLAD